MVNNAFPASLPLSILIPLHGTTTTSEEAGLSHQLFSGLQSLSFVCDVPTIHLLPLFRARNACDAIFLLFD